MSCAVVHLVIVGFNNECDPFSNELIYLVLYWIIYLTVRIISWFLSHGLEARKQTVILKVQKKILIETNFQDLS